MGIAARVEPIEETAADVASVSVIIVTYYTGPLLWRSIHSALQQDAVSEVIVVDNGNWPSTVESLIDLAALEDKLHILTGHNNVGFATGCNLGARVATGSELFILNPDAILPTGAAAALREQGYKHGKGGPWLIGGKLVNPDGTEQAGSRRATLTPWTALVEMLRLDKWAPRHPYFRRFNNHCDPCPGKTVEMPVISGACMLTPRADYFSIGGMDESYFLHAEDVDFCLRFRQEGEGHVLFCPTVDILHMKSSSRVGRIGVERRKAYSLNRYFRRHFPTQYPMGFVSFVCAMVWIGFSIRATQTLLHRAGSLFGLNRRRGLGGLSRALRAARRSNSR
ncbi:glycosyltransferase family 2 protein [Parvularcula sp. LCG005]|uniref:glycosyltransferase family 2 protein n=1 Tax=Parvularcula sp. LCG005 TaxID=3078805 RepID=UPI002941FA4C|nr:glycosyltransferase family 2 protein [Parvularcula sp. LCG005]WOI53895.1 glycosyltransferase family 2 protein [Parvularcula sp. LCG005]